VRVTARELSRYKRAALDAEGGKRTLGDWVRLTLERACARK